MERTPFEEAFTCGEDWNPTNEDYEVVLRRWVDYLEAALQFYDDLRRAKDGTALQELLNADWQDEHKDYNVDYSGLPSMPTAPAAWSSSSVRRRHDAVRVMHGEDEGWKKAGEAEGAAAGGEEEGKGAEDVFHDADGGAERPEGPGEVVGDHEREFDHLHQYDKANVTETGMVNHDLSVNDNVESLAHLAMYAAQLGKYDPARGGAADTAGEGEGEDEGGGEGEGEDEGEGEGEGEGEDEDEGRYFDCQEGDEGGSPQDDSNGPTAPCHYGTDYMARAMSLLSSCVYLAGDGGPNNAFRRLTDKEREAVPAEVKAAFLEDCVKFVCGGFHYRKEVDCNNGTAFSEMFLGVS